MFQCLNNEWTEISGNCNWNEPSCFIAGTMISMADGTEKAIETLKSGDVVLGMDGASNKVTGVETPSIGTRDLYAFNGGNFFVTAEHPFMLVSGQWASIDPKATLEERPNFAEKYGEVKELEVGDILVMKDGKTTKLENIESRTRYPRGMKVYNPLLKGNNTYYADKYLVHNKPF